mmetsp:Transcript_42435/g.51714  ORF Transcript_42435/g.51714 Transcript_42435/m.51714 type:complete len:92 (-) Transcript_42435:1338-1613(-)
MKWQSSFANILYASASSPSLAVEAKINESDFELKNLSLTNVDATSSESTRHFMAIFTSAMESDDSKCRSRSKVCEATYALSLMRNAFATTA